MSDIVKANLIVDKDVVARAAQQAAVDLFVASVFKIDGVPDPTGEDTSGHNKLNIFAWLPSEAHDKILALSQTAEKYGVVPKIEAGEIAPERVPDSFLDELGIIFGNLPLD